MVRPLLSSLRLRCFGLGFVVFLTLPEAAEVQPQPSSAPSLRPETSPDRPLQENDREAARETPRKGVLEGAMVGNLHEGKPPLRQTTASPKVSVENKSCKT